MKLTREMEKEIKKILIHGMYAFKVGYANSDTIRDREQEAIEYYLARDGKMPDAEQMRFYCLIDRMYAHILETLKKSRRMDKHKQIGADRMAYAVARLIQMGRLDSRSEAGDALLDYLDIGHPGGPHDVPTWMRDYEASQNAHALAEERNI